LLKRTDHFGSCKKVLLPVFHAADLVTDSICILSHFSGC